MGESIEQYALGLLAEEFGEGLQLIGKALRFGIDTPGVRDALTGHVDPDKTPRSLLIIELGDAIAAIEYAARRGVVNIEDVYARAEVKLAKLLDPQSRDNLGRRLAP